jgi:uncharacterized integral membrane protein
MGTGLRPSHTWLHGTPLCRRAPKGQVVYQILRQAYSVLIHLLTAIGLTAGSSSTVHIYTQTIHRTTQLTALVVGLSGIRTQSGQTKINDEQTA